MGDRFVDPSLVGCVEPIISWWGAWNPSSDTLNMPGGWSDFLFLQKCVFKLY